MNIGCIFCRSTVTLGFPYLIEKVNRLVAATDPPTAMMPREIQSFVLRRTISFLLWSKKGRRTTERMQCSSNTIVIGESSLERGRRNKESVPQSMEPRTTSRTENLFKFHQAEETRY